MLATVYYSVKITRNMEYNKQPGYTTTTNRTSTSAQQKLPKVLHADMRLQRLPNLEQGLLDGNISDLARIATGRARLTAINVCRPSSLISFHLD